MVSASFKIRRYMISSDRALLLLFIFTTHDFFPILSRDIFLKTISFLSLSFSLVLSLLTYLIFLSSYLFLLIERKTKYKTKKCVKVNIDG